MRGAAVQGQTLFGLNVPSLKALDGSESALRARPAIVGTFADWEHTSDFPSRWPKTSTIAERFR